VKYLTKILTYGIIEVILKFKNAYDKEIKC